MMPTLAFLDSAAVVSIDTRRYAVWGSRHKIKHSSCRPQMVIRYSADFRPVTLLLLISDARALTSSVPRRTPHRNNH